ncbi:(2Fe-2S) ferredoxin domain-containing protein [Hymenobacter sp. BT770]|uniref:(2Fe-2S) ferredoxin domain-containing protein n=1 Tax=Hymenobacter sp. BT770 TaxID=2886942 RepID=UPI001D121940|nr:(2Fe-2S) ferredoxin domain-containing protein [Hymenobacter sp. BT770]MCC3151513.1 (2Fe-2S) ferredoxin domain-containing protein [Hymenobacter sp. BT770]MDO3413911.1 (2Fe-2S) ferredoxin domain-containing protein [Hymenobacter sp. BT770]
MSTDRRLFVCTNQKSGVGEDVAKALKKELKHQGLKKQEVKGQKVRTQVQTCDCLDLCRNCKKGPGAALIVYPEGTVYGNVRPADAAELVAEHIGRGHVVKRLHLDQ